MPCIPARSKSLTETNLGVNTTFDLVVKQDMFVHIKSPCDQEIVSTIIQ